MQAQPWHARPLLSGALTLFAVGLGGTASPPARAAPRALAVGGGAAARAPARVAGTRWRVRATTHSTIDSTTSMSVPEGDRSILAPPRHARLSIERGLTYVEEVLEALPERVTSIRRTYEDATRVQEIRPVAAEGEEASREGGGAGDEATIHRDDRPPGLRGSVVTLTEAGPNLVRVAIVSGSPEAREIAPLRYGSPEEPWRDLLDAPGEDTVLPLAAARRVVGIDRIVALVLAQHLGPGEVDRLFTGAGGPSPIHMRGEVRAGAPTAGRRVARGHLRATLTLLPENQPAGSRWTADVSIPSFEATLAWDPATGEPRSWTASIDLRVEVRAQETSEGEEGLTRFLRVDDGHTDLTRTYTPLAATDRG